MLKVSDNHVVEPEKTDADQCHHHWLIDAAGGPKSNGTCRTCGAKRQFKNSLDSTEWEREAAPADVPRPTGVSFSRSREPEEDL
ncbi:MAG: hypothetical protein V3S37_00600 [Dehalococcoidia bacterium]